MNPNIYQPSGKVSPLFYVIGALFLFIGLPILSAIYTLLHWYVPFIILHSLFTIGYAVVLANIIEKVIDIGKVRNKKIANYFAFFAGVFAMYFIWASYVTKIVDERVGAGIFNINDYLHSILNPGAIPQVMSFLYSVGAWSIKSLTVKGFFLAAIWFLEALIIIVLPWITGTYQAEEPFSEESNSWFEKHKTTSRISRPENLEGFLEALKNGDSSVLKSLEYDSSGSLEYYQITSFTHAGETTGYINFSNVKASYDDKGKESLHATDLIKNVRVSLADLKSIVSV
ncbi:hypothetical protein [Emticicia fontis]